MKSPWMPDYLGGSLRTLGALPGANAPRSPGELQAEFLANQDRMKLADALASQGYVPNSGALGSIAQIFGAWSGNKIKKEEQKKLAELLREESDMLSAAERQKLEDQAKADEAKRLRDFEDYAKRKRLDAELRPAAKPQFSNGLIFDPNTQQVTRTPYYREPQDAGQQTPEDIRKLQAYLQLPPDQRAEYDRLFGKDGNEKLSVQEQKELTAQNLKGIAADNALGIIDELDKLNKQDVGGRIVGNLPGASIVDPRIEQYNALTAQLVEEATRLRRIPGIGTQSNMDLQQAMLSIPAAGTNVETRNAALKRIRDVVNRVKSESESAGRRLNGDSAGISGSADASGWGIRSID